MTVFALRMTHRQYAEVVAIILKFAANEEPDDLHRDLSLTATRIVAKYCISELCSDLEKLTIAPQVERVQDNNWQALQAVTICKRIAGNEILWVLDITGKG